MKTWIVIPCYNEAERLDDAAIRQLVSEPGVNVVLVDDGSTDQTWAHMEGLMVRIRDRVETLRMERNVGKAEAVRQGMLRAIELGAEITGYLDADFATPASEMLRLLKRLENSEAQVLFGSRWMHMGARIERSPFRHYAGRVFATIASNILDMPVYDTQCGAKLFRVTPTFKAALVEPFHSRWAFDVELLGRLKEGVEGTEGYDLDSFLEEPLATWIDVEGSKKSKLVMVRATLELLSISGRLKQLRPGHA